MRLEFRLDQSGGLLLRLAADFGRRVLDMAALTDENYETHVSVGVVVVLSPSYFHVARDGVVVSEAGAVGEGDDFGDDFWDLRVVDDWDFLADLLLFAVDLDVEGVRAVLDEGLVAVVDFEDDLMGGGVFESFVYRVIGVVLDFI